MKDITGKEFCEQVMENLQFTPDALILGNQDYHPFLIYDTMMKEFSDWEEIKDDAMYHGRAETVSENFILYKRKNGKASYPVAVLSPFSEARGAIRGELYSIKTSKIPAIDTVRSNGWGFKRIKLPIRLPFQHIKSDGFITKFFYKDLTAWVYLGIGDIRKKISRDETGQFAMCNWVKAKGSTAHYQFTKQDLVA